MQTSTLSREVRFRSVRAKGASPKGSKGQRERRTPVSGIWRRRKDKVGVVRIELQVQHCLGQARLLLGRDRLHSPEVEREKAAVRAVSVAPPRSRAGSIRTPEPSNAFCSIAAASSVVG